jgi:hypothetical protein
VTGRARRALFHARGARALQDDQQHGVVPVARSGRRDDFPTLGAEGVQDRFVLLNVEGLLAADLLPSLPIVRKS